MGLWDKLVGGGPAVIDSAADLRKGRVTIRGNVSARSPVTSPVRQIACAAFYYKATYMASSRLKGYLRQRLRDALVYGEGITVAVGDQTVALTTPASVEFSRADHQALKAHGYDGFDGREKRIDLGAEVLATGKLTQADGQWQMTVTGLEQVASASAKTATKSNRSANNRRRTKRKKKKR